MTIVQSRLLSAPDVSSYLGAVQSSANCVDNLVSIQNDELGRKAPEAARDVLVGMGRVYKWRAEWTCF